MRRVRERVSDRRRFGSGLTVEALEDRLTPSWTGIPPAAVPVPGVFTAVTLNSNGDAAGNASIASTEIDWYRFTTPRAGLLVLSATTPASSVDTVIGLFSATGQRLAFNDDISAANLDSRLAVNVPAGTYFLGVTNYTGSAGGSYTWRIDAPFRDDGAEENDTFGTARNLGALTATRTVTGLRMADANDWFRFTTTATGTAASRVGINFSHAQGDLDIRLYNAAGVQIGSSLGVTNAESISLSGRPAGTYYLRVYGYQGAENPNYTLTVVPPSGVVTPPPPPPTGAFSITLRVSGLTASQQAIFQQAANRWAQVITGDLPNATYQGVPVDDVLIDSVAEPIDGPGGILGSAGPDFVRNGSLLPIHGNMRFDTADLAQLEASGGLLFTVLHEMGHVLGIGTLWDDLGRLAGGGTSNPRFTGPQATAAYNQIFNRNESSVPVENTGGPGTRDGHFRESVFGNELMTGFLNGGFNPLSRITVGSLADIGYVVNMNAADAYAPPGGFTGFTGGGGAGGGPAGLRAAPPLAGVSFGGVAVTAPVGPAAPADRLIDRLDRLIDRLDAWAVHLPAGGADNQTVQPDTTRTVQATDWSTALDDFSPVLAD
jgi:hypothetical protein